MKSRVLVTVLGVAMVCVSLPAEAAPHVTPSRHGSASSAGSDDKQLAGQTAAASALSYAAAVVADKPSVYYRLGDGGSVMKDSSGHHIDGAYADDVTRLPSDTAAIRGDGAVSGGLVATASAASLPAGHSARTLETWFRTTSGRDFTPLFRYGQTPTSAGLTVQIRDVAGYSITNEAGDNVLISWPNSIGDGLWHLYDVTYDGATVTGYLDGQALGSAALKVNTTTAGTAFQLGGYSGDYDEAAVYPTSLAPSRVDNHWGRGHAVVADCAVTPTSAYAKSVVKDKPSMYLRLGDESRLLMDSSGHCVNAALAASVESAAGAIQGDGDGAVSGGLVATASAASLPAGHSARTLETWFRTTSGRDFTPLFRYGQTPTSAGLTVQIRDVAGYSITNEAGDNVLISWPNSIGDGLWHLYDVTYDGATVTGYLDGQALGSAALKVNTTTAGTAFQLGGYSGDYDEAAVYPTSLAPSRVDNHWGRGHAVVADCAVTPTSAYAKSVVKDKPSMYLRLGDESRLLMDSSGHCVNAALAASVESAAGAIQGDGDGAVSGGLVATASAASLPAGHSARTLETWFRTTSGRDFTPLFRYGQTPTSAGLTVQIRDVAGYSITNEAGDNVLISWPNSIGDGLWHLYDVTYDGATVTGYLDGQALGSAALKVNTTTAGTAFQLGGYSGDYDEAAVYPTSLAPSRVDNHWIGGLQPDGASISGTVTLSDQPVADAYVEACSAAHACLHIATSSAGHYRIVETPGLYAVTVLPPAHGNGAAGLPGAATVTVAAGDTVKQDFALALAALPPGSSLDSPSVGNQNSGSPTVNWSEMTTFRTKGCANGVGILQLRYPETSERRLLLMTESPNGSGNYVAELPPLAPWHGEMKMAYRFLCAPAVPAKLSPTGGRSTGGTNVTIHLPSIAATSPLTGFAFGSSAATSTAMVSPGLYTTVAPSGTGKVAVTAIHADGTRTAVGQYQYLEARLSVTSGPSAGGNTLDIIGSGFGPTATVIFGLKQAKVQSVSPTKIVVVVPSGVAGSTTVGIASAGGYTTTQTYTGIGGGENAEEVEESDLESNLTAADLGLSAGTFLAKQLEHGGPIHGGLGFYAAVVTAFECKLVGCSAEESEDLTAAYLIIDVASFALELAAERFAWTVAFSVVFVSLTVELALAVAIVGVIAVLIDPSGTVTDLQGNPVPGAVVSLERKNAAGGYVPVPDGSATILPTTNPEISDAGGGFSWMAVAGTYRVRATKAGCRDQATGRDATAVTGSYVIPPPALGISLQLPCTLRAMKPPTVTGLSATVTSTTGGETIDVYGTQLGKASSVAFGDRKVTSLTHLSPYALRVAVPAGTGTVDVRVTNETGTSPVADSDRLTYVAFPATAAGAYVPTVLSRLVDTATGTGVKRTLVAKRAVAVTVAGHARVPSSGAGAVTLVLSVRRPSKAGSVTVYADGTKRSAVASLSFAKHQSVATTTTVRLPSDGKLRFYSSAGTDLTAAVAGYFLAGKVSAAGGFVADSQRALVKRTLVAKRAVAVTVAGHARVPSSGAGAVTLVLLVRRPSKAGSVTVYADGTKRSAVASLSFAKHQSVATTTTVRLPSDGKLRFYSSAGTDLTAAVAGYFLAGKVSAAGGFVADSQRALVKRTLVAKRAVAVTVAGHARVPSSGAGAVTLVLSVRRPSKAGSVTVYADGTKRSAVASLSFAKYQSVATTTTVRLPSDGKLRFYSSAGTDLTAAVAGYFVDAAD